ncbi:hypothetical protein [Nocardioides sp. SR21]|uniref:hypothetical protein n=1 Tax=Nocardioides sp. SR21 TaxID=2919501 RepID=UPI001FA9D9B1|nr:hypothetical protein [Nocardioides sp. SR21]
MTYWIIAAVIVAALLLALAWWSSGRSRGRAARPDAASENDRSRGNLYDRGTM